MNFPYSQVTDFKLGRRTKRNLPWLPIELSLNDSFTNSIMPLGLLDSGSGISIVTREIADGIGIEDIKNGPPITLKGVGGGELVGYVHEIYHRLHDPMARESSIVFRGKIAFAEYEFPKTMPQSTAIWGRISVFSETIVTFDDPTEFQITPPD